MAEFSDSEHDELKRKQLRYSIKRASDRVVTFAQVFIAVGGLIAVILINISWLDGPLKRIGLTNSSALTSSVITVMVVSIFFDVRTLAASKIDPVKHHFSDPMDVYPALLDGLRGVYRPEEKTLDIIGMTLYTAWPSIRFWMNRNDLVGWTVRFAAASGGDRQDDRHIPNEWFPEARGNLDSICQFAKSSTALTKNIDLQAYGYDFMPSLHGYRLGNGDLFYSILLWQDDGKVSIDGYSYEFIPHEDKSPSANAIRGVFDSWFRRACVTRWEIGSENKSDREDV